MRCASSAGVQGLVMQLQPLPKLPMNDAIAQRDEHEELARSLRTVPVAARLRYAPTAVPRLAR